MVLTDEAHISHLWGTHSSRALHIHPLTELLGSQHGHSASDSVSASTKVLNNSSFLHGSCKGEINLYTGHHQAHTGHATMWILYHYSFLKGEIIK